MSLKFRGRWLTIANDPKKIDIDFLKSPLSLDGRGLG